MIRFVLDENVFQNFNANYSTSFGIMCKALKPRAQGFRDSMMLTLSRTPFLSSAKPATSCSAAISEKRQALALVILCWHLEGKPSVTVLCSSTAFSQA